MKRALVTGGCGFIGSNLTKELVKQGWVVDVVDDMSSGHLELLGDLSPRILPNASFLNVYSKQRSSNDVVVVQCDFADAYLLDYIKLKNYDVIFHQAAIPRVSFSVENPSLTSDVNITRTVLLFEACIDSVDRVVFASSSSVYGGAEFMPTYESQEKNPKSPYAWQKSTIEDFAKLCFDLYKLDIVCLRYFNVFGPGQYGDSPYATAVSSWCHAIKNGLELRSDGDGSQSRDMCYVDNVVSANILSANSDHDFMGRCYNVACGDRTTNKDILYFLSKGRDIKIRHADWRAGDVMHTQADISRAEEELDYKPLVRFWDGLDKTLKWWGIE